ncbi:MAG: DUF565 domain-containing protein [Gloeocapsa sp. DLM2.Bin57]|nr:MAG: DUF565 domain-containing protein [Gloeocapsa sp. DLM2.Bin57]
MQRTRLDTLVNTQVLRLQTFFSNPWRTISLIFISILLGFFLGIAIVSTAGQAAFWDVPASAVLLIGTETISRWSYSRKKRPLWMIIVNVLKIGLTYSLFLQAFIIGS